jgi:hypothetical protein
VNVRRDRGRGEEIDDLQVVVLVRKIGATRTAAELGVSRQAVYVAMDRACVPPLMRPDMLRRVPS